MFHFLFFLQIQSSQQAAPFEIQFHTIRGKKIPCVNSLKYNHSKVAMALLDVARNLFPAAGHRRCRDVLLKLKVQLYAANP